MEWSLQTAEGLAAALRAGEVTSAELTDEAIARIELGDNARAPGQPPGLGAQARQQVARRNEGRVARENAQLSCFPSSS